MSLSIFSLIVLSILKSLFGAPFSPFYVATIIYCFLYKFSVYSLCADFTLSPMTGGGFTVWPSLHEWFILPFMVLGIKKRPSDGGIEIVSLYMAHIYLLFLWRRFAFWIIYTTFIPIESNLFFGGEFYICNTYHKMFKTYGWF